MHVKKYKFLFIILSILFICGFQSNITQNAWDFYNFDELWSDIPKHDILLSQDFEFDFKPIEDLGYKFGPPHPSQMGRNNYILVDNSQIYLDIAINLSYEDTYNILKDSIEWRIISEYPDSNIVVNNSIGDITFIHDNWILFTRANVFFMISDDNENLDNALKIAKELDNQIISKLNIGTSNKTQDDFKIILIAALIFGFSYLSTKINKRRNK